MIVVDNTVLADWAFGEEEFRSQADALLKAEPEWITVGLFRYELGNVGWKAIRFGKGWNVAKAWAAIEKVESILTGVVSETNGREVLELAVDRQLSYYDASYAWLALDRGLPFYSRDTKLVAKCSDFARTMPECG